MCLYNVKAQIIGQDYAKTYQCIKDILNYICSRREAICAGNGWKIAALNNCLTTISLSGRQATTAPSQGILLLPPSPSTSINIYCREAVEVVKTVNIINEAFKKIDSCRGLGLTVLS